MPPTHQDILDAIADLADKYVDTARSVESLTTVIGRPGTPDGGVPATGIFAFLNFHDQRLKRFERLLNKALGAMFVGGPCLLVLWWMAGDKITSLLH